MLALDTYTVYYVCVIIDDTAYKYCILCVLVQIMYNACPGTYGICNLQILQKNQSQYS